MRTDQLLKKKENINKKLGSSSLLRFGLTQFSLNMCFSLILFVFYSFLSTRSQVDIGFETGTSGISNSSCKVKISYKTLSNDWSPVYRISTNESFKEANMWYNFNLPNMKIFQKIKKNKKKIQIFFKNYMFLFFVLELRLLQAYQ